jgi:hypothetical protein
VRLIYARFHQLGLGFATRYQAVQIFPIPQSLHRAQLIGNFLKIAVRHSIADRAHLTTTIFRRGVDH